MSEQIQTGRKKPLVAATIPPPPSTRIPDGPPPPPSAAPTTPPLPPPPVAAASSSTTATSSGGRAPKRWQIVGLVVAQVALMVTSVGAIATHDTDNGCRVAEDPAPSILECLRGSTAFVRTPSGTGTGLVYKAENGERYLLSNAHVVQPHDQVDIVLDEVTTENVPLVGLDQLADIAVLGPLDIDAPAIELSDRADLVQGEKLFLVGFPGETEAVPTPSIAQGILSRTRAENDFGLTLIQTDASIGGGQSGGALVDANGEVVGISSLRFAEAFALAVSSSNVIAAAEAIIEAPGDIHAWPTASDNTTVSIDVGQFGERIAIPISDTERTIQFDTGGREIVVQATDPYGETLGFNEAALTVFRAFLERVANGAPLPDIDTLRADSLITETDSTNFSVRVPAGDLVFLAFDQYKEFVDTAVVTASEGVAEYPTIGSDEAIELGTQVNGVNDVLSPYDVFRIDLQQGQKVHIEIRSPASDMATDLLIPNRAFDDPSRFEFFDEADDNKGGLYGLDVSTEYTAPETGTYEFLVYSFDFTGTGYTIKITDVG